MGAVEILGVLGLLLPWVTGILPGLTPVAALTLLFIQALAITTEHIPAKEYKALPIDVGLLAMAAFVADGRFVGPS